MEKDASIFIAGHTGLVGSAIIQKLRALGYQNTLTQTHNDLDLRNQSEVMQFFKKESPDYVFLAAARVGGILANSQFPADFIYDNLMIQSNVIQASYQTQIEKLLFLGSSCIYPKFSPQPIKEEYLLDGKLEPTNEPYAIAKIAGIKMCQAYNKQHGSNFISLMPTNLYGPNDNFDLQTSHVLPALIRKFHEAKIGKHSPVTIWGTGSPKREFLHVDDLADAAVFLISNYNDSEIINVGTGKDISIGDLAKLISSEIGYEGKLHFDTSKPDGTPRKILDVSRLMKLGWTPKISLKEGIRQTYEWYHSNYN
ncbi:MAG: GDP-L-fucose synthase family protein [Candidatus Heimdallarchaeota archaeon]